MITTTDIENWYLVQVRPNCAKLALRHLERQGFATFMPLERRLQPRARRASDPTRPYFPGYLFAGSGGESAPCRAIQSTQGVAQLVKAGERPAIVPLHIIEELKRNCDEDGVIAFCEELSPGDNVRVATGPFASFIGRLCKLSPNERAWVLLDVMGQQTRVSIPQTDLRLVC